MRKKDLVLYTALSVCLISAALLHFSLVKGRPPVKPFTDVLKKKPKTPSKEQFEIKTKVTLREIKEIPKKETRKSSREDEPGSKIKNEKDGKERRLIKKVAISQKLLDTGKEMIGKEGERLGKYPSFTVDYRKTLGFQRYARSLLKIGGRFFVMDMKRKKLKAEIDIGSGTLKEIEDLKGFSPRSRNISSESATYMYLRTAQKKYGHSHYSVVLLLPLTIDSLLVAGMEESLKELNLSNTDFYYFRGLYKKGKDGLILDIISGRKKDGNTIPLDIAFNLSKLSMT